MPAFASEVTRTESISSPSGGGGDERHDLLRLNEGKETGRRTVDVHLRSTFNYDAGTLPTDKKGLDNYNQLVAYANQYMK